LAAAVEIVADHVGHVGGQRRHAGLGERHHRDRGGGLHTTDDLDVEPGLLGGRRAGEQRRREQQDKGVQRNRFAHEAHHCGMKVKVRLRWNTLSKPLYGKVLVRRMAFSTERRPASSYGQLESTVALITSPPGSCTM